MNILIADKVRQAILNRKKRGFTARDIYFDSEADMSYVLKIIREQVSDGKLIHCDTDKKGRKHYIEVALSKKGADPDVPDDEPLWIKLIKNRIEQFGTGGAAAVAKELGLSPSTISGVINGKYSAKTDAIESKAVAFYSDADVDCPILGHVKRKMCIGNIEFALKEGPVGSIARYDLLTQCLKCHESIHNCG